MASSSQKSRKWLIDLSERSNLLNVSVPYIPVLLKDIAAYVKSSDYESSRIKTIQTIGFIQREEDITKIVDINTEDIEFPICINQLPVTDIYFDIPRKGCTSIWDYNAVRVYGILEKKGDQIIINITNIFEVKDIVLCEKMFDMLSLLVRKRHQQYFTSQEVEKLADKLWKSKYS